MLLVTGSDEMTPRNAEQNRTDCSSAHHMSHTSVSHVFYHDSLGAVDICTERKTHQARMTTAMEYAKEQRLIRQSQARMAPARTRSPRARRALFVNKSVSPAPVPQPRKRVETGQRSSHAHGLVVIQPPNHTNDAAVITPLRQSAVQEFPRKPPRTMLDRYELELRGERRREAQVQAGRDAQQAFAQSRTPNWWPRTPKPAPRRRVASPNTVSAADSRLLEIRTKLEAGIGLTPEEEGDATAIIELKQLWAEAAEHEASEARVQQLMAQPAHTPRAGGYEAASLLTGGFGGF